MGKPGEFVCLGSLTPMFIVRSSADNVQQEKLSMSIDLPLDQMTLADKLETMERLWANISITPAAVPSPAWHQNVLTERKRLVAEGKVKFLDWDTAISQLRDELRANPPS